MPATIERQNSFAKVERSTKVQITAEREVIEAIGAIRLGQWLYWCDGVQSGDRIRLFRDAGDELLISGDRLRHLLLEDPMWPSE